MHARVEAGTPTTISCELLLVYHFEGEDPPESATAVVDQALDGHVRELIGSGDFVGRLGETLLLLPRGAIAPRRVLIVGLGKKAEFGPSAARRAGSAAAERVRDLGLKSFHSVVPAGWGAGDDAAAVTQSIVEGALLGSYVYDEYKTKAAVGPSRRRVEELVVIEEDVTRLPGVQSGAQAGEAIAHAVNWARDLVNRPACDATPSLLAVAAEEMAKRHGMRFQALARAEMEELGMGALLAVARGSREEPRFIVVEHNPLRNDTGPIVLVGKGVTYDSGGLCLKSPASLEVVKNDMAGGAAVMGVMSAIGALGLKQRVFGIVPAVENMPGGSAYRGGDVVRSITGMTIEVGNTDAEGRLTLADALGYVRRLKPAAVVDLATLTGISRMALGAKGAALFANEDILAERVLAASAATQERVWRFPLWEEFNDLVRSHVADIRNTSRNGAGGPAAAILLSHFTEGLPWAHLDMGAMSLGDEVEDGLLVRRATGYGVRLLVELVRRWPGVD